MTLQRRGCRALDRIVPSNLRLVVTIGRHLQALAGEERQGLALRKLRKSLASVA